MFSLNVRRTLALGACALAAILLFTRGLPASRAWNQERYSIALELRHQLEKSKGGVLHLDDTRRIASTLRAFLSSTEAWLLRGTSDGLRNAALASILSAAADEAGVELTSVQPRPDVPRPGTLLLISARANLSGDVESVMYFLAALEMGTRNLRVRELTLSQPDITIASSRLETLRAEIVVEALADSTGSTQDKP